MARRLPPNDLLPLQTPVVVPVSGSLVGADCGLLPEVRGFVQTENVEMMEPLFLTDLEETIESFLKPSRPVGFIQARGCFLWEHYKNTPNDVLRELYHGKQINTDWSGMLFFHARGIEPVWASVKEMVRL